MTELVYNTCAGSATPRKRILTTSPAVTSSPGKSRSSLSIRAASVTPREDLKPIIKTNDDLWRKEHEDIVAHRINKLQLTQHGDSHKEQKPDRTTSEALILALAKDWIRLQNLNLDERVYVVEKMLPCVVLGVEKLIGEVERRGLVAVGADNNFNPVNFLAQYLMRNNPKYTNLFETSAYTQAVHETMTSIKAELYETHDTRLARLKAEGRRRLEAKAERDRLKQIERDRRLLLIKNLLLDWTRVGLYNIAESTFSTIVSSFMAPFMEKVAQLPEEVRLSLRSFMGLVELFIDKPRFTFNDFNDFLTRCTYDMPSDLFDAFIHHLRQAAIQYRLAIEREDRRAVLEKLFADLDTSMVGQLDRPRVLLVFDKFYSQLAAELRSLFRDPKHWPVVDASEDQDDDDISVYNLTDDLQANEPGELHEEASWEQPVDPEATVESAAETHDAEHSLEISQDAETPNAAVDSGEAPQEENGTQAEETTIATESLERHEVSFNPQVKEYEIESHQQANPAGDRTESISSAKFDEDLIVSEPQEFHDTNAAQPVEREHERTFASLVASLSGPATANAGTRSRSVATSFDAKYLNASQFVQKTENFIGPEPSAALFKQLVSFFRINYKETEEEKRERLLEQQRSDQLVKRKAQIDSLFEKWDNDGAGYLNFVDVEKICIAYKSGSEAEAIAKAKKEVRGKGAKTGELRLNKRDFRKYIFACAKNIGGDEHVDNLVDYCKHVLERAYAEKVRGETRKKWLHRIIAAAEQSGASLEPVYKTVFQILLKDADLHANGKVISANMALLEKNRRDPQRGEMMLKYVAATNDDAVTLLGNALYSGDEIGVSFQVVETGKVLHVPRINLNPNIKFWNPLRADDDRSGALLVVPLKDVHNRVFGTLTADTMNDPLRSIFQTHEINFYQGVARAFSIAFHHVTLRKQLMAMAQSALLWVNARVGFIVETSFYLVEPADSKSLDFALRKVLTMKSDGSIEHFSKTERILRKDSLFRDYLFSSVDTSDVVESDAYGLHHISYPIRDLKHVCVAVLDISVEKANSNLSPSDKRPIVKVLSILQQAYGELAREFGTEKADVDVHNLLRKTPEPRVEQRDLRGAEMFFNQLLLQQVRSRVEKLGVKAYAELRSYKEPPAIVVAIVKALVTLFYPQDVTSDEYMTWSRLKMFVGSELARKILHFDPMNVHVHVDSRSVMKHIIGIPRSEVAQHSSIPADALYNWVYIAMTLYDHVQRAAPPPAAAPSAPEQPAGGEQQPAEAAAETEGAAPAEHADEQADSS